MITRESARQMTIESLRYTMKDLTEAIHFAELIAREYGMAAVPKLSQYYDERFAVAEAIAADKD